ncbi:MAG TPA: amino acid adenylation domain-containing protein [Terriglobales bacterium]|jgi:amino acid adenylation domain-containing protein|nr:amino acid adenylation domain-containing protein [Terriglobales bacterium]
MSDIIIGSAFPSKPVESLDQPLSDATIPTAEERQRLLVEWNQTACDYPRDKCLHELIEMQADRAPDSIAVECDGRQLSYHDFNCNANQLAHYLRSRGVGPGFRVGICLKSSLDFAIATLGVLKSGAACVPLDPKYPAERLAYMLGDVQARVLITEQGIALGQPPAGWELFLLGARADVLAAQPRNNLGRTSTPNDIAYVIYTSGSTGKPRGVLLPHTGLVNYAASMSRVYSMSADDRVLQFCSISFDIALEELFITWFSGATLVCKSEEMPLAVPDFLEWITRERVTLLDLPTAYWHEWVHQFPELRQPKPENLRLVIVGGEKVSAKAYAAWLSQGGDRVRWINTYGPTEASIAATAFEPNYESVEAVPENIPIGRPVANVRIYLLDRYLNPVPVGVTGDLYIAGVGVAQGYLNRPELTAEKFIPDILSTEPGARMYKTGDMARYLPSGEIEFLGRGDDQVKIRGFRVELGEIEAALAKRPDLREVAVLAREDVPGDKRLTAYFVPIQESQTSPAELRRYLQQHLPDYMVPSAFVPLRAMPLTPNGKIDRRGLPAPEHVASEGIAEATDSLQSQLVKIWEDVLGRKSIGVRDNFFELGGHSLLAARLIHRTGQMLGKTVPLAMLFEAPTIEQLASALRRDWGHHWSSLVPIQPAGSQPPLFCVHGVGGNVLGFYELARRMSPEYPLYGLQSQGLDGAHPCHARIDEMAAHYLEEIRSVQPHGPYFLAGFSFGGLVAYEMAQQLRARDEKVGLLVLFDTAPGNLKPVTAASFMRLLLQPSWQHWAHDLPKKARKRIHRSLRNWRVPQTLRDVRNSNIAAADRYVLRPYAGVLTLIRASEKSLRSLDDPHAAWPRLVGGLEIHEMQGDHYEMLLPPQVDRLAECLKGCINKSRLQCEQPRTRVKVS